ncbi:MAG: hypothetical protein GXO82_08800, partial [Chlorobi bacterium]|nr:hypothetical protein [Chlorobiota bacterium]
MRTLVPAIRQPLFFALLLVTAMALSAVLPRNSRAQVRWTSIGPNGGDRHVIYLHPANPRIVFTGGAGGFLYRSTDSAESWESLASDAVLGSLSVRAIVVHPDRPEIILCNAVPLGMYKSTDRGRTWNQHNTGLRALQASTLLVDKKDRNTVYAGMLSSKGREVDGGVYVSYDFGDSWSAMNDGLGLTSVTRIYSGTDGTLYAATLGQGLFVYDRNGQTWKPLFYGPDSLITAVAVSPRDPRVLIAGTFQSWLFRSKDGGTNWRSLARPTEIGTDTPAVCYDIAFDPQNPDIVWTRLANPHEMPFYRTQRLGGSGTFFSVDGGDTWKLRKGGFSQIVIDGRSPLTNDAYPPRSSVIYMTGGGGSAITKSTDGGVSFRPKVNGIHCVFSNFVLADKYGRLFAGAEKGFELSRDGGLTWQQIRFTEAKGERVGYKWHVTVDPVDSSIVYCAKGEFAHFQHLGKGLFKVDVSRNTGEVLPGTQGTGVWMSRCGMTCDTLYIATQGHGVWKSTNGGLEWKMLRDGLEELSVTRVFTSRSSGELLYCVTRTDTGRAWSSTRQSERGGFYRWNETTSSWEKRITGMPGPIAVSDLAVAAGDETWLYVSTFAHGIYRSTDGGNHWEDVSPPGVEKVYSLTLSPADPNYLFAGTAFQGVWRTADGGKTWTDTN